LRHQRRRHHQSDYQQSQQPGDESFNCHVSPHTALALNHELAWRLALLNPAPDFSSARAPRISSPYRNFVPRFSAKRLPLACGETKPAQLPQLQSHEKWSGAAWKRQSSAFHSYVIFKSDFSKIARITVAKYRNYATIEKTRKSAFGASLRCFRHA
jgi:hypothetical protein